MCHEKLQILQGKVSLIVSSTVETTSTMNSPRGIREMVIEIIEEIEPLFIMPMLHRHKRIDDTKLPQNFIPGLTTPELPHKRNHAVKSKHSTKNMFKSGIEALNSLHLTMKSRSHETKASQHCLSEPEEEQEPVCMRRRSRSFSGSLQAWDVEGPGHTSLNRSHSEQRTPAKFVKMLEPNDNMSLLHPEIFVSDHSSSAIKNSRSKSNGAISMKDSELKQLRSRSFSLLQSSKIRNDDLPSANDESVLSSSFPKTGHSLLLRPPAPHCLTNSEHEYSSDASCTDNDPRMNRYSKDCDRLFIARHQNSLDKESGDIDPNNNNNNTGKPLLPVSGDHHRSLFRTRSHSENDALGGVHIGGVHSLHENIKVINAERFFHSSFSCTDDTHSSDELHDAVVLRGAKTIHKDSERRRELLLDESSLMEAFKNMDREQFVKGGACLSLDFFEKQGTDEVSRQIIDEIQEAMRSKLPKTFHAAVIDPSSSLFGRKSKSLKTTPSKSDVEAEDSQQFRNRAKSLPFLSNTMKQRRKNLKKQNTLQDVQQAKSRSSENAALKKKLTATQSLTPSSMETVSPPPMFHRALRYTSSCDDHSSTEDLRKVRPRRRKKSRQEADGIRTCVVGEKQYTIKHQAAAPAGALPKLKSAPAMSSLLKDNEKSEEHFHEHTGQIVSDDEVLKVENAPQEQSDGKKIVENSGFTKNKLVYKTSLSVTLNSLHISNMQSTRV